MLAKCDGNMLENVMRQCWENVMGICSLISLTVWKLIVKQLSRQETPNSVIRQQQGWRRKDKESSRQPHGCFLARQRRFGVWRRCAMPRQRVRRHGRTGRDAAAPVGRSRCERSNPLVSAGPCPSFSSWAGPFDSTGKVMAHPRHCLSLPGQSGPRCSFQRPDSSGWSCQALRIAMSTAPCRRRRRATRNCMQAAMDTSATAVSGAAERGAFLFTACWGWLFSAVSGLCWRCMWTICAFSDA